MNSQDRLDVLVVGRDHDDADQPTEDDFNPDDTDADTDHDFEVDEMSRQR